jgi:hypothetical protein
MKPILLAPLPAILLCLCGLARAEQVANPVYEAWARQKPGASVTMKIKVQLEGQAEVRELDQKETLTEVLGPAAIIERTVTRVIGGTKVEEPGERVKIPATIDREKAGLPMRSLEDMSVTGMKEGKEQVEVQGRKLETVTREFTVMITKGGKSTTGTIKTWYSADVPGGMVKVESSFGKPVQTAVITVTEMTEGK